MAASPLKLKFKLINIDWVFNKTHCVELGEAATRVVWAIKQRALVYSLRYFDSI